MSVWLAPFPSDSASPQQSPASHYRAGTAAAHQCQSDQHPHHHYHHHHNHHHHHHHHTCSLQSRCSSSSRMSAWPAPSSPLPSASLQLPPASHHHHHHHNHLQLLITIIIIITVITSSLSSQSRCSSSSRTAVWLSSFCSRKKLPKTEIWMKCRMATRACHDISPATCDEKEGKEMRPALCRSAQQQMWKLTLILVCSH